MKALVVAAERDEVVVRALLDDAAFVEHVDFVGILDGRESVSNGDGGSRLHEALQRVLHEFFGLGVEGRG